MKPRYKTRYCAGGNPIPKFTKHGNPISHCKYLKRIICGTVGCACENRGGTEKVVPGFSDVEVSTTQDRFLYAGLKR